MASSMSASPTAIRLTDLTPQERIRLLEQIAASLTETLADPDALSADSDLLHAALPDPQDRADVAAFLADRPVLLPRAEPEIVVWPEAYWRYGLPSGQPAGNPARGRRLFEALPGWRLPTAADARPSPEDGGLGLLDLPGLFETDGTPEAARQIVGLCRQLSLCYVIHRIDGSRIQACTSFDALLRSVLHRISPEPATLADGEEAFNTLLRELPDFFQAREILYPEGSTLLPLATVLQARTGRSLPRSSDEPS